MQELSGKCAIVTGAASGIGLSLSKLAVIKGMNVVMTDVNVAIGVWQRTGDEDVTRTHAERLP